MRRRRLLGLLGAAVVLPAPLLSARSTATGVVQPGRASVGEYDIFLREYYALYNSAGAAQLADFYAADATLQDPSFELDLKGRERIGQLLMSALAKYDSVEFDVLDALASGDQLAVRGLMRHHQMPVGARSLHVDFPLC